MLETENEELRKIAKVNPGQKKSLTMTDQNQSNLSHTNETYPTELEVTGAIDMSVLRKVQLKKKDSSNINEEGNEKLVESLNRKSSDNLKTISKTLAVSKPSIPSNTMINPNNNVYQVNKMLDQRQRTNLEKYNNENNFKGFNPTGAKKTYKDIQKEESSFLRDTYNTPNQNTPNDKIICSKEIYLTPSDNKKKLK